MYLVIFFFVGACLGSFIPCFAVRRQKGISQLGQSYCFNCGNNIEFPYLVPIFGYFLCRGRCNKCHAPISKSLPFFELLFATAALWIGATNSSILHAILICTICALLLLLSIDDWNTTHIRDSDLCVYSILIIVDIFFFRQFFWFEHCFGAIIVSLPLLFIMKLRSDALGSGDVLFMSCSGFYLGTRGIAYAFLLGIICALAYAIYLLLMKNASRYSTIPLIPFLAFGVAFIILFVPLT